MHAFDLCVQVLDSVTHALEYMQPSLVELHCAAVPDVRPVGGLTLLRRLNLSLAGRERQTPGPVSLKVLLMSLGRLQGDTATAIPNFRKLHAENTKGFTGHAARR